MSNVGNSALVETTLTRAAEQLGDITEPVMADFYRRFPEARAMFAHHGRLYPANLEGEMVQQALYCLMHWFEAPGEVEIVLLGSVPHHNDTLEVPPAIYQGLLQATAAIIGDTIPAENLLEQAAWQSLREQLAAVIEQGGRYVSRRLEAGAVGH